MSQAGRRSTIESLSNPLVKRMRLLREKRHRRAEGLFLAEGLRIATEAREAGVLVCSGASSVPALSAARSIRAWYEVA